MIVFNFVIRVSWLNLSTGHNLFDTAGHGADGTINVKSNNCWHVSLVALTHSSNWIFKLSLWIGNNNWLRSVLGW